MNLSSRSFITDAGSFGIFRNIFFHAVASCRGKRTFMKNCIQLTFCFLAATLVSCAQQKKTVVASSEPIAFPGAEGYGKFATGGRGGKVFIVSNLNDAGPGSFRDAVEKGMKRTVVFAVSGTIHLESRLTIRSNVTIAGQTAPGDGICLADYPVSIAGDNIIIRYLRFRMGDKNQKGGMVDGNGGDDAVGGTRRNHIILDHCSMSWSTDEVCSIYAGDSTTIQWCFITEPLNYSYHFESGDKDYEHHGYGGIWGGRHLSAHHNLFAHCNSRNPRFDGIRNAPEENVDFRNNVIYNWGGNNIYAGEGGHYNLVANYFKYGPSTSKNVRYRIVNPFMREKTFIDFGTFHVSGNFVDGSPEVSADNVLGVHLDKNAGADVKSRVVVDRPHPAPGLNEETAARAYESVLKWGGCNLPNRDTMDQRIVKQVRERTGGFVDVQGGYPHGTAYEQTVHAWPALRSLPAAADGDSDGMPDVWEKKMGLDPTDAKDAAGATLHPFYTNLEMYCNSLIP